jgi:hypothetical protein
MIWVCTSWIPNYINQKTKIIRIALFVVASVFFLAFLKNQYRQNAANWEGIAYAGVPGYSETQWKESPTIQYISAHKEEFFGAIYSNAYDGLYYLTGVKSLPLPHKEIEIEKQHFLSNQLLIVVWFYDGVNTDLIDIAYIQSKKKLIRTKNFEDGAIYFFGD